jgi:hypothetical protein
MNPRVDASNAALRDVADAHELPLLSLHDQLVKLLPPGHRPPPSAGSTAMVIKAALSHLVLRRSFHEIGRRNGLAVLTDHTST